MKRVYVGLLTLLSFAFLNEIKGEWVSEQIDETNGDYWRTIAFHNHNPSIAYTIWEYIAGCGMKEPLLYYAEKDIDQWEIEHLQFERPYGDYPSLVLDADENPHIVFCEFNCNIQTLN